MPSPWPGESEPFAKRRCAISGYAPARAQSRTAFLLVVRGTRRDTEGAARNSSRQHGSSAHASGRALHARDAPRISQRRKARQRIAAVDAVVHRKPAKERDHRLALHLLELTQIAPWDTHLNAPA